MRNGCIRRLDNLEPPSASDSSAMESIELDEMSLELPGAFWKWRTNTLPHERTRKVTTDLGQTISINLRTYKQIHTPTVVQRGGEGWMEPLPGVFDMLQYFETILPLVESLWSSSQDEVYFMGGGAAGGLWRYQQWSPSWPPSWILPRIGNQIKTARNVFFCALQGKITHK